MTFVPIPRNPLGNRHSSSLLRNAANDAVNKPNDVIPTTIANTPAERPTVVTGDMSLYPTVVIVAADHHKASTNVPIPSAMRNATAAETHTSQSPTTQHAACFAGSACAPLLRRLCLGVAAETSAPLLLTPRRRYCASARPHKRILCVCRHLGDTSLADQSHS